MSEVLLLRPPRRVQQRHSVKPPSSRTPSDTPINSSFVLQPTAFKFGGSNAPCPPPRSTRPTGTSGRIMTAPTPYVSDPLASQPNPNVITDLVSTHTSVVAVVGNVLQTPRAPSGASNRRKTVPQHQRRYRSVSTAQQNNSNRPGTTTAPSTFSETMFPNPPSKPPPITLHTSNNNSVYLLPPSTSSSPRLVVVLDLDETLLYGRDGKLVLRPHVRSFLGALKDCDCEVVLWTAAISEFASIVANVVDPKGDIISHIIPRHPSWYNEQQGGSVTKDLRLLGRDLRHTLIIENTPSCVRHNPENAIVVEDFYGTTLQDATFRILKDVVMAMAMCVTNNTCTVTQFCHKCPALAFRKFEKLLPTRWSPGSSSSSSSVGGDSTNTTATSCTPTAVIGLEGFALFYAPPASPSPSDGCCVSTHQIYGGVQYPRTDTLFM